MRTHLLLLSPWAYDTAFKTRVVDGDLYGLWAHAAGAGIDCLAVDGQHRVVPYPDLEQVVTEHDPTAVLAHLWTADNYGEILEAQCRGLANLRKATGVPVIAFGYLAVTAAEDILESGAADAVKVPHGFRVSPTASARVHQLVADSTPVAKLLAADATGFASLRRLPEHAFEHIDADTTFSVRASRAAGPAVPSAPTTPTSVLDGSSGNSPRSPTTSTSWSARHTSAELPSLTLTSAARNLSAVAAQSPSARRWRIGVLRDG